MRSGRRIDSVNQVLGQILPSYKERDERSCLEIVCQNKGWGIVDLESVTSAERTNTRDTGVGLPGARRLMDEFEIDSQTGVGTRVAARSWQP